MFLNVGYKLDRRNFLRLALAGAILGLPPAGYFVGSRRVDRRHPWLKAYEQDLSAGFKLSEVRLGDLEAFYTRSSDEKVWGRLYDSLYTPNVNLLWDKKGVRFGSPGFLSDPTLKEMTRAK